MDLQEVSTGYTLKGEFNSESIAEVTLRDLPSDHGLDLKVCCSLFRRGIHSNPRLQQGASGLVNAIFQS